MLSRFVFSIVAAGVLASACSESFADAYDPPLTYYGSATGFGATLKSQLQSIASSMTGVNYGNARFSAPYTDADPNASDKILLIYNRASVSEVWDEGATWNREHIWPVSRLGVSAPSNTTTNLATDQFNLRPANPSINSSRSNKPFGLDSTTGGHGHQGSYYYPGDTDAGDVARAQFYMSTRYTQLTLTDGTPSGTQMGDLSSLLNYHYRDVPDAFERRRNHTIYGLAGSGGPALTNPHPQRNRNPFVDHPEFVWSVFVDQMNDSQLTLQGGAATGAGGSTVNLDFGRVLVGAPAPVAQPLTINNAGVDGTYFEVTTSGVATSSISGRNNAFRNGATDSRSLNVGLAASTATAGLKSGSVTIDNLDVTTGGGAGHGANDANDVINLNLSVLDHANPSFNESADVNVLNIDFGVVSLGSTPPVISFDLANLGATFGYTAGLELNGIAGIGSTSTLTTDLVAFRGSSALPAGDAIDFSATFDTAVPGMFSALYTLNFSDENLPGASLLSSLTLSLSGVVEASAENADFDGDGDVDGADFLTWQRGLGLNDATQLQGDANSDNIVNEIDLAIWGDQFDPAFGAVPVPEPATAVMLIIGSAVLLCPRQRRQVQGVERVARSSPSPR